MIHNVKKKVLLKGMPLDGLNDYFVSIGESKFRGGQVFNWMYNHLVTDFTEMKNLPKELRNKLSEDTIIKTLDYVDSEVSESTGTKKFILETNEHNKIESVIIPDENRRTL